MFWAIAGYSALGCIGMAVLDSVGTVLVKAISSGRAMLAGMCDVAGDLAKMSVLSVATVRLLDIHWGWLGLLPVLITGFFVTYHATRLSQSFDEEEDSADDDRDAKLRWMERELIVLKREIGRKR